MQGCMSVNFNHNADKTSFWYAIGNGVQARFSSALELCGQIVKDRVESNFFVYPFVDAHKNSTTSQNIVLTEGLSCGKMNAEAAVLKNMEKLERMKQFGENWNGYGASPISRSVIGKAECLLPLLFCQPKIFPTACNSIQFEYEKSNGEYLELEVTHDKIAVFQIDVTGNEHEFDVSNTADEINKVVKEFYGILEL